MAHSYYGDKISKNMVLTPEGYLVCKDVPIGRIGWMDYYGQEIPAGFEEPTGKLCKVYRSPEELFSEATMASFEGKPVTNTHPSANLDVSTAPMIERGHAQNVRRDGDFLIADLHIKDAGLISEVQNNLKRETSSGYNCSWVPISDGKYEQREIVGNHVAIVPSGRAGPKVAIHDSKPKIEGSKKMKITKNILAALGFKHYAQDAEPEDIAKAMDAMKEDDVQKEPEKKEPEKKEVKDDAPDNQAQENAEFKKLADEIKALKDEIAELKKGKEEKKETADSVMDAVEKELEGDKEVKDEYPDEAAAKKKEGEEKAAKESKKPAADAALKKFVQDMKPIIMAIPDETTRLAAAKKFSASVRDSRSVGDSYADIISTVAGNKKAAMDAATTQKQSMSEAAEVSCNAWKTAGEKMKGGK